MRVVFLDFDGVITTLKSRYHLDPEKMELVKRIVDATDAKIVITSSWRRFTLEDTIKSITDTSSPHVGENPFVPIEAVIGVTARMYGFKYSDPKKHYSIPRGVEIERWINEHPEVEQYVILDDDCDMLYYQRNNFVHTDTYNGISEADVEKAIKILNKK